MILKKFDTVEQIVELIKLQADQISQMSKGIGTHNIKFHSDVLYEIANQLKVITDEN